MVSFTPRPLCPRGKSPRYPLDKVAKIIIILIIKITAIIIVLTVKI
jgi:hypothetical protein